MKLFFREMFMKSLVSFHPSFNFFREIVLPALMFAVARELRISHDDFVFFRFMENKTFHSLLLFEMSCPIRYIHRGNISFRLSLVDPAPL
jgi:hypothetical protein